METPTLELTVQRAEDLRAWWLDGFSDGGLFVPGVFPVAAGAQVNVRVVHEEPTTSCTLLSGTVVWRRYPPREGSHPIASLRPGVGVAFNPSMRKRVLFLERLSRGTASEGRRGLRYPASLPGELVVREGERGLEVRVEDVSPHGARVTVSDSSLLTRGARVRLWVAHAPSGESSFAALEGETAWVQPGTQGQAGIRLHLATANERLHWARVVTRAREALGRLSSPAILAQGRR